MRIKWQGVPITDEDLKLPKDENGLIEKNKSFIDFVYDNVFKNMKTEQSSKVIAFTLCAIMEWLADYDVITFRNLSNYLKDVYLINNPDSHHVPRYAIMDFNKE